MRYLGASLISGKLSTPVQDGKPLNEKIIAKINAWKCKKLPFEGRLQLLQLSKVSHFSRLVCLNFLEVIKIIKQKFNRFLWKGQDYGAIGC